MAEVPSAAAQSTADGRELHRLTHVGNRLYAAYGDYNANTGPIDAVSLDLTALTVSVEAAFETEQTWTYRSVGGSVYVPYVDLTGPGTGDALAIGTDGVWSIISDVGSDPVHVHAVVVTTDGIFLFGCSNEPDPPNGGATVWRSTDDGATWTVVLAPRPDPTNFDRFYTAWAYGDDIYAMLASTTPRLFHWPAGGPWEELEYDGPLITEVRAFTYDGTPFHLGLTHGKPEGVSTNGALTVHTQPADAAVAATILAGLPSGLFRDACTDGTYLYLLQSDGTVHRGDTSGVWTVLFTVNGATPASIAVADGYAYFGIGSSIYRTAV